MSSKPQVLDGSRSYRVWGVIYGTPGIGKTTLSATTDGPLFLEFDPDGTMSIANSGHMFWDVDSFAEWQKAEKWMKSHKDKFNTIIFDTITHFQNIAGDELAPRTQLEVDRRYWGKSFRQLRKIFEDLRDFPHDIIFNCDEKFREIKSTGKSVLVPALSPAPLSYLSRLCRLTGRLYVEKVGKGEGARLERRLQVCNDGRAWGKDSSGRLPQYIANPNLGEIISVLRTGSAEPESEPEKQGESK